MKFSRKLIFLATILIVVSIISIYFGSVKSIEGATACESSTTTDASGKNITTTVCPAPTTTTPTTATPTTATTAPTTTAAAYYKTGSPACSVSGPGFTNTICGGALAPSANGCKSYNTTEKKWYNPDTKNYTGGLASKLDAASKKYTCP
jgi:hypothetical protein